LNKREKEVLQNQLDKEKAVMEQLKKQYDRSLRDIEQKTKVLMFDIQQLDEALNTDGLDDRSKEVLESRKQSKIYQKQQQDALKKQVSAITEKLHSDEYSTIEQYLKECYTDAYVGTMYDLAGQGIPIITPIDQTAVVRAVTLDSKISKGLYTALGVDTNALKIAISAEISRGIATGQSYAQIARNLTNVSKAGFSNAMRIVRTEGHRIQNASTYDAQQAAKAKGCNVVKQWDSTLDGKTRPTHRELDGQIREVEEYFEVAGKKAKYPGDFNDPAEDCNCRCTTLTRARWALGEDELKTLQDRARFFGLDKSEGFEDYKKKYIEASKNDLKAKTVKSTFTPAKTIAEAEEFAKQFVDSGGFGAIGTSYAGVHLDIANAVNRAINDVFSMFNLPKLGGIAAPAKNTKLGKMVNAHAAYSPIRKSILMDRNKTKKASTMLDGLMEDKKAITNILTHPERYDFNKLSTRIRKVIDASSTTGRSIVAENITETIIHELGHHMEKVVSKEDWDIIKAGMVEYATKISGYSVDSPSEYFAESFTSYMKGESYIDPALRAIFDRMRK